MIEVFQTNKLIDFKEFLSYSPNKIFIETGTCYGRSVEQALKDGYENIFTVEAKDDLFEYCVKKFNENLNIALYHGKSTDKLPEILREVEETAIFWLDAHPSGELSAGHDDLIQNGQSSEFHQHNILLKELELVLAHRKDHVIIIDDQNGINNDNRKYIEIISKANPDYCFFWYDEQMGEIFYKDKILVVIIDKTIIL